MLLIRLLRLHHWIKNLFLFTPIFFAGEFFNTEKVYNTALGFLAFGLIASSIYVLNDIRDIEEDRNHPRKSTRPIASGEVSLATGYVATIICLLLSLGLSYYISISFLIVVVIYFTINVGYSLGLKNISILDIMILAAGFELRVIAGGVAADVPTTQWLMVMIFLLALFLAITKRREDVRLLDSGSGLTRKSVSGYNIEFLNASLISTSSVIVVSYIMYCFSSNIAMGSNGEYLVGTTIFVIAGLMRYMQIALVENNAGSPIKIIYTDRFIIITILAWMIVYFLILYL
jgi:4-hydroxybenzoate polyprenyltransferase